MTGLETGAIATAFAALFGAVAKAWIDARGTARDNASAERDERQLSVDVIKANFNELKATIAECRAEIADLRSRVNNLERENQTLMRQHAQDLAHWEAERRDLLNRLTYAERKAALAESFELEIDSLQAERISLQAEVGRLTGLVQALTPHPTQPPTTT